MQGAAPLGGGGGGGGGWGGILPNLLFFKRKIVRRGSKMDHVSANLAFGEREKIFGGSKSSRGARKTGKKVATFFFFSFFLIQ